jgi:3-hydroxy-5-methyl-1-naphthoate 3-O-methyltransferase
MTMPLSPGPLIQTATAYWGSATLIAAIRLEIFTHIEKGAQTAASLASALEADVAAVDALLSACASLDLLEKEGDSFTNTPLAQTYLVDGQPGYLGPALLYNGDVYPLWGQLDAVVKRGHADKTPDQYLGDDEARTRNFVYGMHHRALGVGRAVAQGIDLSGRSRLADIGGGPGTYSALLTDAHPGLTSDVLDLPGVVAIAAQIVSSMGASERVSCVPFDYYNDTLTGSYDAVLISGVLHREQPEGVRALLKKASDALTPGGVLYISDVMLDDDRAGPLFGTMFALNMRVLAHDGRCHSVGEQTQWLSEVGLEVVSTARLPAPIHYTIIRAEKRS